MLKVGDRFMQIKRIEKFNMKKAIFEITEVVPNMIYFKLIFPKFHCAMPCCGMGWMTPQEFEGHFIKVRNWTPWEKSEDWTYEFRTDDTRYVDVMYLGKRARASCHPDDKFDLQKGIDICIERIKQKIVVSNTYNRNKVVWQIIKELEAETDESKMDKYYFDALNGRITAFKDKAPKLGCALILSHGWHPVYENNEYIGAMMGCCGYKNVAQINMYYNKARGR